MRDLAQTSLIMLALRCKHLKLLLQTFQCFFDRLLAFVSFFISRFEIGGEDFTVLGQGIELLVFAPQSLVKLLYQTVLLLNLFVKFVEVALATRLVPIVVLDHHPTYILTALISGDRVSLIDDISVAQINNVITNSLFLVT